jgi:hypothetical protein
MKKLGLILLILPFMAACGSNANTTEQKDEYKLNKTQLNLTIGDEYQLKVTKNGKTYSNVTWSSNYSDYCDVSSTGLVSAYYEHTTVTITAKISKSIKLTCSVKVSAPKTDVYRLFSSSGQGQVNDKGHVLYIFAKAGITTDSSNTYNYNLTFEYDTFSNICTIVSKLSWTQSGYNCMLMGYNIFYWGEYKTGLFGGYYYQTNTSTNETKKIELSFPNENILFSYAYQEIFAVNGTITYVVEHNDFSSVGSNVEPIFIRVQECPLYAKQIFETHNYDLKLITI